MKKMVFLASVAAAFAAYCGVSVTTARLGSLKASANVVTNVTDIGGGIGGVTTNDVCNIVTNVLNGGEWVTNITATSGGKEVTLLNVAWGSDDYPNQWIMNLRVPEIGDAWRPCAPPNNADANARTLSASEYPELVTTRGMNELGLAYQRDIEPSVLSLIESETGGTNTLAHYATPAWTNGVAEVVTNEAITVDSPWVESSFEYFHLVSSQYVGGGVWSFVLYNYREGAGTETVTTNIGATASSVTIYSDREYYVAQITLTRTTKLNALGLARFSDLPNTNGLATVSITNGLQSVANAYQMETNAPSRYSSYLNDSPSGIGHVLFFTLNPLNISVYGGFELHVDTTTSWPNTKGVFAKITVPSSYTVASNIRLVGYSAWPTSCTFQAYVWRCDDLYYVNIISILED